MITLGGDAELELVDSLDPFTEGVVFSVRPPKKSWKNISNLSGGEKTLSSLALVSMKKIINNYMSLVFVIYLHNTMVSKSQDLHGRKLDIIINNYSPKAK